MFSEIELKFLIIDSNPASILRKIADLKQLDRYTLIAGSDLQLTDLYFDTSDSLFQKNKIALRFRKQNRERFITIKGNKKIQDYGAVHRLEVNKPWSENSFNEIIEVLSKTIPAFNPRQLNFLADKPINTMQSLGLHPIQERSTVRQIRFFLDQLTNSAVAEGAIDETVYKIDRNRIIHYELEIELKKMGTEQILQNIKSVLLSTFPDSLELWIISKLELGIILEKIIKTPVFRNFLDKENHLSPEGYHYIRKKFELLKK